MHGAGLDFADRQGELSRVEAHTRQGFGQDTSNLTMSVLLADAVGRLAPGGTTCPTMPGDVTPRAPFQSTTARYRYQVSGIKQDEGALLARPKQIGSIVMYNEVGISGSWAAPPLANTLRMLVAMR